MMWPIVWTFKQHFQQPKTQVPQPQKPKPIAETTITIEDVYRLLII